MPKPLLEEYKTIFSCVHCKNPMIYSGSSLTCTANHSFDISRYGHVNFITHPVKKDYDKAMLTHRRSAIRSGLFNQLLDRVAAYIKDGILLDAGCGEGSQLGYLAGGNSSLRGIGIDLSKDGIILGAKGYKDLLFIVGDLANLPFASGSIASIVNILSPANYSEFLRVLKPEGALIKVVPNPNYLGELRRFFYKGTDKEDYSNQDVIAIFSRQFPQYTEENVTYSFPLNSELLGDIISMSPLFWNLGTKELPTTENIPSITMDFTILIGTAR